MKLPPVGTPVLVSWLDTTTYGGWRHHKPGVPVEFSPRKMQTLGFFMGSNPVGIYVVPTLSLPDSEDHSEGHLDAVVLPNGCVTSLRRVSV